MKISDDWAIKFASLLLCEGRDSKTLESINCKELVTVHCLICKSYFCQEHNKNHFCST